MTKSSPPRYGGEDATEREWTPCMQDGRYCFKEWMFCMQVVLSFFKDRLSCFLRHDEKILHSFTANSYTLET